MGPTILLDKSALQAFSSTEMCTVTKHFQWNKVDILFFEIICNLLKKPNPETLKNKASILADKIWMCSVENMNYIELCLNNLRGFEVIMDGRPIVKPTSISTSENGQRTAFIDGTKFSEMIHRWQKGEFNENDKLLANLWKGIKDKSKADDCLKVMQAYQIIIPKCTSIDELIVEIEELLRNPNMEDIFLEMFLSYEDIEQTRRDLIRKRIKQSPYSLFKIAPYAYFCIKVLILFYGAYKFDLLSKKKKDDQIDLEYLFYLPFCDVFTSNDNFHKTLAPVLMRKNQCFLRGVDLKNGLQELNDSPAFKETMKAKCFPVPPMPKNSIIRSTWIKTGWLYS